MQPLLEVKDRARETWATGQYDAMMRQEGLYGVGERLARRLELGPADTVLDIACGSGNAAIPAALAGARVTGLDLTPRMLELARSRAAETGAEVEWVEGDAEDLPFEDGQFDVVVSTFGCMFAPRHETAADEIARVLRPHGRVGICSWTPEGVFGDFFRTVAPHLPAPPEFVDPPLRWGEEGYVRELFEGSGVDLRFERESWEIAHDSPSAAVECYTTAFGPVVEARRMAEAEGRWPQLRDDMLRLFERHAAGKEGEVRFAAEYLLAIGRKEG